MPGKNKSRPRNKWATSTKGQGLECWRKSKSPGSLEMSEQVGGQVMRSERRQLS